MSGRVTFGGGDDGGACCQYLMICDINAHAGRFDVCSWCRLCPSSRVVHITTASLTWMYNLIPIPILAKAWWGWCLSSLPAREGSYSAPLCYAFDGLVWSVVSVCKCSPDRHQLICNQSTSMKYVFRFFCCSSLCIKIICECFQHQIIIDRPSSGTKWP